MLVGMGAQDPSWELGLAAANREKLVNGSFQMVLSKSLHAPGALPSLGTVPDCPWSQSWPGRGQQD